MDSSVLKAIRSLQESSGVYVTNANTANLATTAEYAFRHNPFAKYRMNFEINQSIKELLNIPEDYPFKKTP